MGTETTRRLVVASERAGTRLDRFLAEPLGSRSRAQALIDAERVLVAKSNAVHRALKQLLADRGLRREYLALVDGLPEARTGTIEAPIGRHRRDRVLMSIDSEEPREARTHFELVQALPAASLLRV